MKRILAWVMSVLLALACINISQPSAQAAGANLVVNGSFEEPEVTKDWKLSQGPNIEVQQGNAGKPYDGKKLVELDSTAVSKIYQDIPTEVGKAYKLTFAFSPRPGVADNKLNVYWGDTLVAKLKESGQGLSNTKWQVYTYDNLKATETTTRLSFDDLNEKSDTLGSYIDAISLVAQAADSSGCPDPTQGKNLVVNGSFEEPTVELLGYPESVPGWQLFAGSAVEFQQGIVAKPYDGKQIVELDGLEASGIYQDIATEAGKTYKLTFAFSPRPDVADNKLKVLWGDTEVVKLDKNGESLSGADWQVYTYDLKATSDSTRLSFDDLDETSDGLGSYIDGVSVVLKTACSS